MVERELVVEESPEEVWDALSEPDWLGDGATVELAPAGEVRAGDRSGFVEEAEEPRRLVFWWSAPDEDATRVVIELEELDGGTRVSVTETRPLEVLTWRARDLEVELGARGGAGPVALALH